MFKFPKFGRFFLSNCQWLPKQKMCCSSFKKLDVRERHISSPPPRTLLKSEKPNRPSLFFHFFFCFWPRKVHKKTKLSVYFPISHFPRTQVLLLLLLLLEKKKVEEFSKSFLTRKEKGRGSAGEREREREKGRRCTHVGEREGQANLSLSPLQTKGGEYEF